MIQQILRLNRKFYELNALDFSRTRNSPWEGWDRMLDFIKGINPTKKINILDVGCGNGRFYGFLEKNFGSSFDYTGIDLSEKLMEEAKQKYNGGNFIIGDFLEPATNFAEAFDVVVGFGIMHHIPTYQLRVNTIKRFSSRLKTGGLLILTFWSKIPEDLKVIKDHGIALKQNDYILGWGNDTNLQRYVHIFDTVEIEKIKKDSPLQLIDEYITDGKKSDSNTYLIWKK